jgi:predicted nucleic acid-binding protein
MATGKPLWYWDTCVFLAWIKNEARAESEMDGIFEMSKAVDKGESLILTSVLTRIEVLESTLSNDQKEMFQRALRRPSIQSASCDMRVADKAHQIRDFYQLQGKKLHTPDAIHLATAIIYGVDVLYTFDGAGKNTGRKVKLVPLSGNVAGHNLRVEIPQGKPNLFSTPNP